MKEKHIYITENDYRTINNFIRIYRQNGRTPAATRNLARELEGAEITAKENIPADVITLNSRFMIKNLDDGTEYHYTLVLPKEADISNGKISVFTPLGSALIGSAQGDIVEYNTEAGKLDYLIEQIDINTEHPLHN